MENRQSLFEAGTYQGQEFFVRDLDRESRVRFSKALKTKPLKNHMITLHRWQRIKEIFQSAQERTPTERLDFLNQACGDDKTLREEVEALITADESNDGDDFLSTPAYEFAAGMLSDERARASEFEAGQKVGRYTILCPLGAGGMGQIYLAQDEQLGRKIALKLIATEFASDERRVRRFEQEARAASALNHPNVCVIHETGVTENKRHFIAMEYIQGITLRDKLTRERISLLEAIHVARQVADALAAAHAAGIVHRDIKPENIMLRPDGYVKVLDFGLAKLTEMILPEGPLDGQSVHHFSTGVRTETGTLMGTVKYMSPEQLREMEFDERTDIWSLGVVLYEMVTRTTPFESRTPNGNIALIVGPQAPTLDLPNDLPASFREIVKKALEKDRGDRYQTVTKFAADLTALQRELERENENGLTPHRVPLPLVWSTAAVSGQKTRTLTNGSAIFNRLKSQAWHTADSLFEEIRTHKAASLFAGVTVVFALLLSIPPIAQRFFNSASQAKQIQMRRVTNAGTSVRSTITRDGRLVAHVEEQDGKQRLMFTSTVNNRPTEAVAADAVDYLGLTFSPDNQYLYFTREDADASRNLYRVPSQGGLPEKVKEHVDSPVSFSPQGHQFAFVRLDHARKEYLLIVCDIGGANEFVVASRKDGAVLSTSGLAWSPDGRMIVCPAGRWDQGYHMDLLAFDVKDQAPHMIAQQSWFLIYEVAWQDDMNALVISAKERETTPHQLWRITYPAGEVQKITPDLNEYLGAALAGDKIVTVQQNRSWGLWVADLSDFNNAKSITTGTGSGYGVTWAATGYIVYSSMIQDHLNISRIAPNGNNYVKLTELGDNYNPATSADGRFIVYSSKQNTGFNIWRMNSEDGGDLKQLTFTDANFYPSVSPDGQWIAYDNLSELKGSVWKMSSDGGTPVKLADGYRMPAFSPDNKWVAVRYDAIERGANDLVIYSVNGGAPVLTLKIPRLDWQRVYWLNNQTFSYLKSVNGSTNVFSFDFQKGAEIQLTQFKGEQIYSYAWSPDFKQVACQRGRKSSDVTIISSER
jgi:eukaryotic-like serine/threonine-protein kinase